MDDATIKAAATVLGMAAVVTGILFAAAMWHASKYFASTKDVDASVQRVHRRIDENRDNIQGAISLMATVEDRTGDVEGRVFVLEERSVQEQRRMTEQMTAIAATLRDVMDEVKVVVKVQHELAVRMERIQARAGDRA